MIPLYIGYDPREAAVYHVFTQSVIEHASGPVSFTPLHSPMLDNFDGQQDATNAFIYSRYLVPELQNYQGWAIFCDGDQIVTDDIYKLYELRDPDKAVMVVPHDYKTKHSRKYIGSPIENDNVDYPRKNWSSVMMFNCSHPANKMLTREFVATAGGEILHRFQWLHDDDIGHLPMAWNHLVGEQERNPHAKLYHHTLGSPGFTYYAECESSRLWNTYLLNALNMVGERQAEMVRRAHWRTNGRNYESGDTSDRDSQHADTG